MKSHFMMKKNETGSVPNKLRENVAFRLETERIRRKLTHKEFVILIRSGAPDERFSYGTYIKTHRRENNVTLRTLDHIAQTLGITIADLLYGEETAPDWARKLDAAALRLRLSKQLEKARESRGIPQVTFAKYLNIAEVTYGKIMHQKTNFTVDTVAVIAAGVGKSPVEFLFG